MQDNRDSKPSLPPGQASAFNAVGRIAAVDYGTKRIGVAISDPDRRIASPWAGYERQGIRQDALWFCRLAKEEEIVAWVVGLPVFPSGNESPKSREARQFADWLRDATGLPVGLFDERYSTAQADTFMAEGNLTKKRRNARRDMLAAQVILAAFLEYAAHQKKDDSKTLGLDSKPGFESGPETLPLDD